MAAGTYKNGVEIIVVYQAVNCATGKTVTMDVYNETHVKDDPKSVAEMTEVGTTGRYYAAFTPDAEGEWIVVMKNTTDSNGEVVKAFGVCDHDVDSIGDKVAAIDALTKAAGDGDLAAMKSILDTESGVKALVSALENFNPTTDTVALVTTVTTLTGHTPQTGDSFAIVNGASGLVAIKTLIDTGDGKLDVIDGLLDDIKAVVDGASGLVAIKSAVDTKAPANEYDTEMARITENVATEAKQDIVDGVVDGIKTDLDNETDGLGAIKGAVDDLGSPAMVG